MYSHSILNLICFTQHPLAVQTNLLSQKMLQVSRALNGRQPLTAYEQTDRLNENHPFNKFEQQL